MPKKQQLRPRALPTIFPWNEDLGKLKTAGKTQDQVEKEHDEAMDLENELVRDANSLVGKDLHPGNSRYLYMYLFVL